MEKGDLFEAILSSLIFQTEAGQLIWKYAQEVRDKNMGTNNEEDSPGAIIAIQPGAIVNVEFADIDFSRSYYCHINAGALYLLYQHYHAAGKDGAVESWGFEFRLQTIPYNYDEDYETIIFGEDELLRLETAIKAQMEQTANLMSVSEDRYRGFRRYAESAGGR